MSAKFKHPDKPSSVKPEDWNRLEKPAQDADRKPAAANESMNNPAFRQAREVVSQKDPSAEQGLNRLLEIVKKHLLTKQVTKDPELAKKQKAISAYQKVASTKKAA